MNLQIRDSRQGDETEVYRLVEAVLADCGLEMDPAVTDKDLADIQAEYVDAGGAFRIVEVDGKIVGSYGLHSVSDAVCELRKMYLLPAYQGQGVGRRMMDDLLVRARNLGFGEIVLETNSALERARELYQRYGFEPCEPKRLSDRCDMAMRLRL